MNCIFELTAVSGPGGIPMPPVAVSKADTAPNVVAMVSQLLLWYRYPDPSPGATSIVIIRRCDQQIPGDQWVPEFFMFTRDVSIPWQL